MNKKSIGYIKKNEVISMPDLMKRLKENNEKVSCRIHKGFWLDIGRHDDYQKANDLAAENKLKKIYV